MNDDPRTQMKDAGRPDDVSKAEENLPDCYWCGCETHVITQPGVRPYVECMRPTCYASGPEGDTELEAITKFAHLSIPASVGDNHPAEVDGAYRAARCPCSPGSSFLINDKREYYCFDCGKPWPVQPELGTDDHRAAAEGWVDEHFPRQTYVPQYRTRLKTALTQLLEDTARDARLKALRDADEQMRFAVKECFKTREENDNDFWFHNGLGKASRAMNGAVRKLIDQEAPAKDAG